MKARIALLLAGILLLAQLVAPITPALASPSGQVDQSFSLFLPIIFGAGPAVQPTQNPTASQTLHPTVQPTESETPEPTETGQPTVEPTQGVTPQPTVQPTGEPTVEPTVQPTVEPTQPANSADLALDVTSSTKTVLTGQSFSYILTVTNLGPNVAAGVEVTNTLPAGLSLLSTNPVNVYDSASGKWAIGNLAANASATLTLNVKANTNGPFIDSAVVSAQGPDPDGVNNTDTSRVDTVSTGTTFISDDFNYAPSVRSPWAFVNPKVAEPNGDSSRAWTDGTHAYISVMGGSKHEPNCVIYHNCAPRLIQKVSNPQNFVIRAKFESENFTGTRKRQGLVVEEEEGEFLIFDYFTEGNGIYLAAWEVSDEHYGPLNLTPQKSVTNQVRNRELLYLEIERAGNQFTMRYSVDGGSTWNDFVTYAWVTHPDPTKTTVLPRDRRVSVIGVYAGNGEDAYLPAFTARIDYVFNMASPISPEDGNDPSGLVSDDFNTRKLGSKWTLVNPLGTSNVLSWTANQMILRVPEGKEHDIWGASNTPPLAAPHVVQRIPNTSFDVDVKFDSTPKGTYTAQGLIAKQDATNFIQFYYWSWVDPNTGADVLYVYSSIVRDGVESNAREIKLTGTYFSAAPMYLRLQREGWVYRLYFSNDETNWVKLADYTNNITINQVGILVGNEDEVVGDPIPGFTGLIDHFQNMNAKLGVQD